jgi:hypothetical protein
MIQSVTIAAKSSDGKQYQITFTKTDTDKGSIALDPGDGYELYDIRAALDNSAIRCKASVTGPDPTVTCSAVQEGHRNLISVEIATILGTSTNDYDISKQDYDRLKDFIEKAGFPH